MARTSTTTPPRRPLPGAAFHILLALAGGERHGYALMREVAGTTGGRVRLGPGTLYGSIRRLIEDGLIEESAPPETAEDGGPVDARRRYYRLTSPGRRAAAAEAERLAALVDLSRSRRLLARARRA